MTKMTPSTIKSCASHGKGISSRRRSYCIAALAFSVLNMLLSFTNAGPVFSKNFQVSHHIQAGRNIRHLPCKIKRSGMEGVCMFAIDCLKSNGTHLGTCIDRFYFGSCCRIEDERNEYLADIPDITNELPSPSPPKYPSSNYNPNKISHNKTLSNSKITGNHVTTTEEVLTDEFTRKPTTTRRPFTPVSSLATSPSVSHSSSSHKPTTTGSTSTVDRHKTTTAASTTFEMISTSSGVIVNTNTRPSHTTSGVAMSTGTTVFATLSTKLPSIASSSSATAVQKDHDKTTGSSSTNKPSTTVSSVPLESTAAAASTSSPSSSSSSYLVQTTNKNQDSMMTIEHLEFTTFQTVNTDHTAVITSTRRPTTTIATTRKPISVITRRPPTKAPFVTTTTSTKVPPRKKPSTKKPAVQEQQTTQGNSTRPPTTTRRPVSTLADVPLVDITISPPKPTTKKPLQPITKKPQVATTVVATTTQSQKKPTKPIVVPKIPTTLATTTTTTTTTTLSPADEAFVTMTYVDTTRAPRPKPKPTANIEPVSSTGWEEDLITVDESDDELQLLGTTNSPFPKEDGSINKDGPVRGDTETSDDAGGERRTTTQKPVKITTSVKVETTTSTTTSAPTRSTTTTTEEPTAAPTTTPATTTPGSTTTTNTPSTSTKPPTTQQVTTPTTSSSSVVPPVSSTTVASTTTPLTTTETTTPQPPTTTSSSTLATQQTSSSESPKPLLGEETSGVEEEENGTTLAEGIVTWTSNIDPEEEEEDAPQKNVTTEDPQTSQWVPLLTLSSEDVKNTSNSIATSDRTTTPMTPTLLPDRGNATVIDEVPTTIAPPTQTTDDLSEEEKEEFTTITSSIFGNETTTISSADVSAANTTTRPSFPSLEGIDYKMICGKRMFPEPRIVGGAMASFGRWPWQISLRQWRTSTYLHKCGAALLNENWAITAAHCVDNVPPSDLLLRLGEFDLAEEDEPYGYQERRVQIVASHPQFDPRTFEYDLALLRFYEPVVFQPNIIPICVPDTDENFIGRTAFVTGWGRLYEDGPLPSKLQEVSVPVIENKICETMYRSAGYIEHIPHIFICAGWKKGGYDSCEGDSGGPMVIQRDDKRFQLAGVISWGIGCAEPDQPGVYTRISEFRDWINQILQF